MGAQDGTVDVAEHLASILAVIEPFAPADRPIAEVRGRILLAPALAAVDVPAFDNSAMDGFAVRFADVQDTPVTLRVVADLPAGTAEDPRMDAAEAARIMTGAPLPTDATAVVPFEDTRAGLAGGLEAVTVERPPRADGAHIRRRGSDVRAGDVVVAAGLRLTAGRVAALAAAGIPSVPVSRAPRVAVVSTGSELVPPGEPLQRGRIPESNSLLLAGLAEEAGADVVLRGSVDDQGDGLRRAIADAAAAGADAVVLSGGVSAGAYEVVRMSLGGVMRFSQVRMQPGRPQGFGYSPDGMLLFGLPGNPTAAAVSFELFVRPALSALEGAIDLGRPTLALRLAGSWRGRSGRTQYVPVAIDRTDPATWRAIPPAPGAGGSTRGFAAAGGLAVIPPDGRDREAGDAVDVMLW
ncbi:gephyrin-like molybdotransferase Glp [Microbacterium enclense]|uniref:molybdopterin molybdotransferase MoeA n=1 Tax=Microbacterium enclense TaxID=993073 RepID=UPI0036D9507F